LRPIPQEPWLVMARRAAPVLLAIVLPLTLPGCRSQPVRRPQPLAVRVEPVSTYPFPEQVQTISTLEAPEEVNLAAQAGGRIQSLLIRQGDQVRAGQLLVVLDQTQLQEQVRALQGQRQESLLNYQRFEFLARQGAASAIQRDAQRQNLLAADANLRARRADLAYRDLRAPIDGVVSDVAVKPGDVISAGSPFTTIQRTTRLLARLEVPSRYGSRVRPGQAVRLRASGAGPELEGQVVSIDPRVNSASQTFLVKAALNNAAGRFRNGERVATRLLFGDRPQLAVPALAVTRVSGQTFVFVAGSLAALRRSPGNVPLAGLEALPPTSRFALQRPVSLDRLQEGRYPLRKGLEPGESLIVSNLMSLRHGTAVTPR
jgi:RND family efflux transporter MFP subunit